MVDWKRAKLYIQCSRGMSNSADSITLACCVLKADNFIDSVWVARKPPGYAFIDFDDKRDAMDAIKSLNGKHSK